ncbi:helix-turn-helix domain-containing protein [Streptomyces sp. NPDC002671]
MNPSGAMASAPVSVPGDTARALSLRGAREITSRGLRSVAIDQDELTCFVLALDGARDLRTPLLTAVAPRPAPSDLPRLLADAASVLSLTWQAEEARRRHRRLRVADAGAREAVLHLLMSGQTAAARKIAGALQPELPEVLQVYVVEGLPEARDEVAYRVAEAADDAWIVPCPVYADHLLVLAPVASEAACTRPAWACHPAVADSCWIGVSDAIPLRDTATGYAQAFHALAVARQRTDRLSAFAGDPDLALTLGPAATAWAESFLAPLRSRRPKRPQDPDCTELLATATSWLSFSSGATAHLKIHRNTLAARLACVQDVLCLDLTRLADQSALALALRTSAAGIPPLRDDDAARGGAVAPTLDQLLLLPHVVSWAHQQFHSLQACATAAVVTQTLTTWLRLDARIGPTADALSLSASAVRKRLARAEELLQRSLTRSPSAVHDLWLAQRALELAERAV